MRYLVTGGTGFVGGALVDSLLADGHRVGVVSRSTAPRLPKGAEPVVWERLRPAVDGADAVVHLAGESIAAARWSPQQKERIRRSRVETTRALVEALAAAKLRPASLVTASAVGYYGPRGDEELTEDAAPGSDFLAGVCVAAESEAARAAELGVHVAPVRIGLVLGPDGGALPRLALPFRLFAGGPLGSGGQWVPWIHRADLVALLRFVADTGVQGPVNGVAPRPVTNRDLSRTLGRVLGRPSWLPTPAFALRLLLGEVADGLLLSGQRAVPARALGLGFTFRHPELEAALREALA